ncbi:hypothetical protein [Photobacterium halotolerans]|uniref:Uncharacterized protein n=1 Tax=Photobacterium halotolerans TaxID=265726 RepID=A0A0F5VAL4_9GAMM|nr:hypothetical protein [Photobacterium halotolerans]KKC98821.1 hypothetical protein KY46_15910 [Photobacterium halotolerans]
MDVKVEIKVIQLNQVNLYQLREFPKDRIKTLISELNVHYEKINNYLESEVSGDKIDVEVIDSLVKLNEVYRLAPPDKISFEESRADFIFFVELLESVIALLNTKAGSKPARNKLLELGWDLLEKLYNFSYKKLVSGSLLYHWLKKNNLLQARRAELTRYKHRRTSHTEPKIRFEPSDEEIEDFYEANKHEIYMHMIFKMNGTNEDRDPLAQPHESNYYHYYKSLESVEI